MVAYHDYEDKEMLDKATQILEKGGCSGTTIDFLETILWHGFSLVHESAHFERQRLRGIIQLHQP
jgi:hypothetical protein